MIDFRCTECECWLEEDFEEDGKYNCENCWNVEYIEE